MAAKYLEIQRIDSSGTPREHKRKRGPSNFRQRDVEAACKAVRRAGYEIARVLFDGGKFIIITGPPSATPSGESDEWNDI
jgi:hypothetical protein